MALVAKLMEGEINKHDKSLYYQQLKLGEKLNNDLFYTTFRSFLQDIGYG